MHSSFSLCSSWPAIIAHSSQSMLRESSSKLEEQNRYAPACCNWTRAKVRAQCQIGRVASEKYSPGTLYSYACAIWTSIRREMIYTVLLYPFFCECAPWLSRCGSLVIASHVNLSCNNFSQACLQTLVYAPANCYLEPTLLLSIWLHLIPRVSSVIYSDLSHKITVS